MSTALAFDLGASSGRALLGRLDNGRLFVEELHRFPNDPVLVSGRLHWDILRLYHEIKQGLLAAKEHASAPSSVAIDSWAVDFGFIGTDGELLRNPYHYRNFHSPEMMEEVLSMVSKSEIYSKTGIQFLPFNTIYQLYSIRKHQPELLAGAKKLLMIPDLLRYFLTGEMYSEFSNASTTQMYNPLLGNWDQELISKIQLPLNIYPPVLQSGENAGNIRASVIQELGLNGMTLYTAAEHDTGSAVVSVPALQHQFAYLSCGTWSLIGTEIDHPMMTPEALELNFTNEGGACGTYRLLKNIMGLWILQESRRVWANKGALYSFPELVKMAEEAEPFVTVIDPDHDLFLTPGDMPSRIQELAKRTAQPVPITPGEITRCILESLALKYRLTLDETERVSGRVFDGLHMVGGGIYNELLCQWTANAIGRPVWAGPAEGSAIGNLAIQFIARGEFSGIMEARRVIRNSVEVKEYEPQQIQRWEEAYQAFRQNAGISK
ncbi:rhamnulokinase family protein [Paenibacillus sp. JSM ZJ436]|uniref:rhamnulokinase family protein n=1 Tax=Paenibacillus sp. JSM ZJ436 TaxID=3376190 RepID=UPI003798FF7B